MKTLKIPTFRSKGTRFSKNNHLTILVKNTVQKLKNSDDNCIIN